MPIGDGTVAPNARDAQPDAVVVKGQPQSIPVPHANSGATTDLSFAIDLIVRDPALLARERMDPGVVAQYAERMLAGDTFPPVQIFDVPGRGALLVDGHHRIEAALAIGRTTVAAAITRGSELEAFAATLAVNRAHGAARSHRDLRATIRRALLHSEFRKRTDTWLAQLVGCSDKTVRTQREALEAVSEIPRLDTLIGADGKGYPRVKPRESVAAEPALESTAAWDALKGLMAEARVLMLEDPCNPEVLALDGRLKAAFEEALRTADCADITDPVERMRQLARRAKDDSMEAFAWSWKAHCAVVAESLAREHGVQSSHNMIGRDGRLKDPPGARLALRDGEEVFLRLVVPQTPPNPAYITTAFVMPAASHSGHFFLTVLETPDEEDAVSSAEIGTRPMAAVGVRWALERLFPRWREASVQRFSVGAGFDANIFALPAGPAADANTS